MSLMSIIHYYALLRENVSGYTENYSVVANIREDDKTKLIAEGHSGFILYQLLPAKTFKVIQLPKSSRQL